MKHIEDGGGDDVYTIPEKSAAPDVGTTPKHHALPKNFAGDKELAKIIWKKITTLYQRYSQQPQREEYENTLDEIDKMYRMSPLRPTGRDKMQTHANVRDSGFYRRVSTQHANEVSILLPDQDLPAKYVIDEQALGNGEYTAEEGKRNIEDRNALAAYTWEADNVREKFKEANWLCKKDANIVFSTEWEMRESEVEQKVRNPKTGEVRRQKVKRLEKDCPTFIIHDIKDTFFDTTIRDIQRSNVLKRWFPLIEELYEQQALGLMMNVGDVTSDHLYRGDDENDIEQNRQTNAGEAERDTQPNGELEAWDGWIRLPVDEKGVYNPKKNVPVWLLVTFTGKINCAAPACLRIFRKPLQPDRNPFHLAHSHRDNKGAINMGNGDLLRCLHWEQNKNLNQAIDNKDLRNRAFMVLTGQCETEDLTVHPNKVIKVGYNSKIERFEPGDTTQITMQMHERIEDIQDKTANTSKPITGETAGGRTSATEIKQVRDQAQLPLLESADYFAQQVLIPYFEDLAALWDQWGDPKRKVYVTGRMIDASKIWGGYKVKVSVITEYANNTLARQQLAVIMQNVYPLAAAEMTPEGRKAFWQWGWKVLGMNHASEWFGFADIADAERVAREESYAMLGMSVDGVGPGVRIVPEQGQNHNTHLYIHESILQQAKAAIASGTSPVEDQLALNVPILEQHIVETKAMQDRQAQQMQAMQDGPQNPQDGMGNGMGGQMAPQPSEMMGENTGRMMAAQEGMMANAG